MKTAQLTITKATSQARRIVRSGPDMPGVFATVESRHGWDAASDQQTVITTITFPENRRGADLLALALRERLSPIGMIVDSCRIIVTRVAA